MIQLPELPKCICGKEIYKREFIPNKGDFIGIPDYRLILIPHKCKKKINDILSSKILNNLLKNK